MAKSKKIKVDEFGVHEVLHATHIIGCMIDDHLIQHPAISQNKKLLKRAEKISELIGDLYQDIGNIDTDKLK